MGLQDRANRGFAGTRAQEWRSDLQPEDTAPGPLTSAAVVLSEWGVDQAEARALIQRQMCPVCGLGPWKSPLNHVSRKHGIARFTMRDLCGLTVNESVADPELSERFAERGRSLDLSAAHEAAKHRKPQRWTQAGLSTNTETIQRENVKPLAETRRAAALAASKTPEALAKRADSMRARWDALPPEERAARTAHLDRSPERMEAMRIARWANHELQPCGTAAAYKRGCRCEECRRAKRESRTDRNARPPSRS